MVAIAGSILVYYICHFKKAKLKGITLQTSAIHCSLFTKKRHPPFSVVDDKFEPPLFGSGVIMGAA